MVSQRLGPGLREGSQQVGTQDEDGEIHRVWLFLEEILRSEQRGNARRTWILGF